MRDDWKKFEGQVFDNKFPLQHLLGSRSYSAVFLTKSAHAQPKNIAIKLIDPGAKGDSRTSLLQRASRLSHPNLLSMLPGVRGQLADMDLVFVVLEYAEEDIGRVLRDRPLTAEEVGEMLGPVLDALNYIHSKGFAHSHIKPSNILAVGNQLKLASDTVLPLGEPRPAHRPTDAYDAPETGTALVAGPSDIWSLGVTLVEMFTQHAPVSSSESPADPIVPSTIPQPFHDIAQQCLRRDPLLRWTTAQIANCLNSSSVPVPAPAMSSSAGKIASTSVGALAAAVPAKEVAPTPLAASTLTATVEKVTESKGLWVDSNYCWVVICKNHWFHRRPNIFNVHRIPLGQTDAVFPRPRIDRPLAVRCDECGREYMYEPSDILRYEMEAPASLVPHPLFRD